MNPLFSSPYIFMLILLINIIEYYKKYLIACEYLQIDPSHYYSVDFVRKRVDYALSKWDYNNLGYKKFKRNVIWLKRNYKYCAGLWYGFVKKSEKYVRKGKLIVHSYTITREYTNRPLSQMNYDYYIKKERRLTWITVIIIVLILAAFFAWWWFY